jgi:hypothetical protein
MRFFRYRRPSVKTLLGFTKAKKRVKKELGITDALKPFRWWTNLKRRVKRKTGYESDSGRLIRNGLPATSFIVQERQTTTLRHTINIHGKPMCFLPNRLDHYLRVAECCCSGRFAGRSFYEVAFAHESLRHGGYHADDQLPARPLV